MHYVNLEGVKHTTSGGNLRLMLVNMSIYTKAIFFYEKLPNIKPIMGRITPYPLWILIWR